MYRHQGSNVSEFKSHEWDTIDQKQRRWCELHFRLREQEEEIELKELGKEIEELRFKITIPPHLREYIYNLLDNGYLSEYPIPGVKGVLYRLDFGNPNTKDCVELDGPYHQTEPHRTLDQVRDIYLKSLGWSITRVSYDNW